MIRRLLLTAATIVLLIAFALSSARAQDYRAPSERPTMWHLTVGHQIATHLRNPDVKMRDQAMQLVITLAMKNDSRLDLSPAAPALVEVYKTSVLPERRLLAVSAIISLDDENAQVALAREALIESSPRVRMAILRGAQKSQWIGSRALAESFNALLKRDAQLLAREQTTASEEPGR